MSDAIAKVVTAPQAAPAESPVPAPEAPKAAAPPDQDPATRERWAQLARKEKSIRAQARQLQEREAALKAQAKPSDALTPQEWKQRFMQDPAAMGLTHDELAQLALGTPKESFEISQLRQELTELRGLHKSSQEQAEKAQQAAYQQALKQVAREVNTLVQGGNEYEVIKTSNQEEAVVELIETTYKEDGILLSASEAAKQVEDFLLDEALKLVQLGKVKQKLSPPATPAQEQPLEQKPQQSSPNKGKSQFSVSPIEQHARTLTNQMGTITAHPTKDAERRAKAIRALMGQSS